MVDMYSLGMVIVTLLTGDVLTTHEERQRQTQEMLSSQPSRQFIHPATRAASLVNNLIRAEPHLRPTATQALLHEWFHASKGLSKDLEECEARAFRGWQPRNDSCIVERLPDLLPSNVSQANNQIFRRRKIPDIGASPYFNLHRHIQPPPSQVGSLEILNELKARKTCFISHNNEAEEVDGSDIFKKSMEHEEESIDEQMSYAWANLTDDVVALPRDKEMVEDEDGAGEMDSANDNETVMGVDLLSDEDWDRVQTYRAISPEL